MRFSALTLSFHATASTALAGTISVTNPSSYTLYLTITRSDQSTTQSALAPNGSYSEPAAGSGNSLGITKNSDYYSASTPKLIFGYSVDTMSSLVYWTVSSVDGSPFTAPGDGFAVTVSNSACAGTSSYDGQVRTCESAAKYTLSLV